jgi:hypothetical protein
MRVVVPALRPHRLAALVAALTLLAASPASAGTGTSPPCAEPGPSSQVFAGFLDPAFYYLAQDGSFEERAWGGGRQVHGNEPWFVGARSDRFSMAFDAPVTSPALCIAPDAPTIRFFARRTSLVPGALWLHAVVRAGGADVRLPLRPVRSLDGGWTLTDPTPIIANLLAPLDTEGLLDGRPVARVRIVMTPSPGTSWQVDDVYVDPYRRN